MTAKNEYAKYKRIFDHGNLITKTNKKIGFNIKLFAVKGIFGELKQYPDKEKETDVKKMLVALNEEKGISGLQEFSNSDEFKEFLENMFANVDDQDRYGEVNLRTAQSFRICADLIEVMKNWGDIPFEWGKKMKYCKFKSVDITKCIKNGTTPVRGNPNEKNEDNELEKELKEMNQEIQNTPNQNQNNFNENFNINTNNNFQENPNDFTLNLNDRISLNKIESRDFPKRNTITHNFEEDKIENFNINDVSGIDYDQQINNNTQNNLKGNHNPFDSSNNEIKDDKNVSFNPNSFETGADPKEDFRKSRVDPDDVVKIQKFAQKKGAMDLTKLHKKLDFPLPVKYKSPNHFKLQAVMVKLMSNAKKEIESNSDDKAMENLNLVKYYLTKIEQ